MYFQWMNGRKLIIMVAGTKQECQKSSEWKNYYPQPACFDNRIDPMKTMAISIATLALSKEQQPSEGGSGYLSHVLSSFSFDVVTESTFLINSSVIRWICNVSAS